MGLQLSPQRMRYAGFVIALIALVVILFLIAPLIWSVLQIFIIAGLLSLVLDIPVHWQVVRGVPRWAATLNTLTLLVVLVGAVISFLIPPLIMQSRELSADLPGLWTQGMRQLSALIHRFPQIEHAMDINRVLRELLTGAGSWAGAARSVFATALGTITATALIIVIVFYTLLNPRPLLYGVRGLFPTAWWGAIDHVAHLVALRMRAWAVGTLTLATIIGVMDYLALSLINLFIGPNLPFILFFAMLGGLLEVIPVIGPIIAATLPALVGFSIHPLLGLLVLGSFFVIQQLEADVITPYVFHRAVQLHPVSIIFALVVLSGIFGLFGAIIAVPVAATLKVIYDEWYYPLTHGGDHPTPPPSEVPPRAEAEKK